MNDFVCRRVELGRHGMIPETSVHWEGHPMPTAVMRYRNTSLVAYAELFGPSDLLDECWGDFVDCAGKAADEVGIETIVASPADALADYAERFHRHSAERFSERHQQVQVSLSAMQEPNSDWMSA